MRQEPKADRRIVSRGEYIAIKIRKARLNLSSILLVFAGMACLMLAYLSVLYVVFYLFLLAVYSYSRVSFSQIVILALIGAASLVFGWFARILARLSDTNTSRADQVESVVLLTRANAADLPVLDSLVRASAEPVQEQEAALLRAVTETPKTLPEQLLRAVNGQK